MCLDKTNPDFMRYNRMFVDLWGLFKLYYSPKCGTPAEEDAWWEAFITDANELCKRYEKEPLIKALLMCLSDEFARKYRENKEKTDENCN